MKLYFSPLACSLATRIALYEAGAEAQFVEVDGKTKRTSDDSDFQRISGLGMVPVLVADDGRVLAENAAILPFVADRFPAAALAPTDPEGRTRLHQWLSFIGTELHKTIFVPLLDETAPEAVKAYALARAPKRLDWLATKLEGRSYLLDTPSVADAYLFAVLNWSAVTAIQLRNWPALAAYMKNLHARPAFARAFEEEKALWIAELQRRGQPLPAIAV
jgi:glutathione S-transferase